MSEVVCWRCVRYLVVVLVVVLVIGIGPGLQVSTVPHDDGNDEELS